MCLKLSVRLIGYETRMQHVNHGFVQLQFIRYNKFGKSAFFASENRKRCNILQIILIYQAFNLQLTVTRHAKASRWFYGVLISIGSLNSLICPSVSYGDAQTVHSNTYISSCMMMLRCLSCGSTRRRSQGTDLPQSTRAHLPLSVCPPRRRWRRHCPEQDLCVHLSTPV